MQTVTQQVSDLIDQGGPGRWWRPDDFSSIVGAKPLTVDALLARMASAGRLHRVRRGLYWCGDRTRFGMMPPGDDDVVHALVGTSGVGPAGLSAANDLGLTTQVPARTIVAVPARPPRSIPRVRWVNRAGRPARRSADLSWTEVALLEVLADWDQVVEVDDLVARKRLAGLLAEGHVRASPLIIAAAGEPAAARRRFFDLLVSVGMADAATAIPMPGSVQRQSVR
jgi:hypothetical protein